MDTERQRRLLVKLYGLTVEGHQKWDSKQVRDNGRIWSSYITTHNGVVIEVSKLFRSFSVNGECLIYTPDKEYEQLRQLLRDREYEETKRDAESALMQTLR